MNLRRLSFATLGLLGLTLAGCDSSTGPTVQPAEKTTAPAPDPSVPPSKAASKLKAKTPAPGPSSEKPIE